MTATVATRPAAPPVAAAHAEWFTAPHPGDEEEAGRLVELACVAERAREAQAAVAGQIRSFGLGLEWSVRVLPHWSRGWEYPWVLRHGGFGPDDRVLDVGGAGSLLPYRVGRLVWRVDVLDTDLAESERLREDRTHRQYGRNIDFHKGDGADIPWYDDSFDKVVCCSVLEHTADPPQVMRELWRVLKPGGRLLVTLDVADEPGLNCAVDLAGAAELLRPLGVPLPDPAHAVRAVYDGGLVLRVLAFWVDKAG